ncbi:MAG: hypothetical protein M1830_007910 [Pleopsidium flavum]|nr:MAG: hypothetical protein M1830_007910 [Pleopsidium flavum]
MTVVEVNLRLPSMLHGKKGFERIVWAFNKVLNSAVTWLFYDCEDKSNSSDGGTIVPAQSTRDPPAPVSKHHPIVKTSRPQIAELASILVPPLGPPKRDGISSREDFEHYAVDLSEWLGLLALDSPRLQASDSVDVYLSRYEVPFCKDALEMDLVRVRWRGLLPAKWITQLFLESMYVRSLHHRNFPTMTLSFNGVQSRLKLKVKPKPKLTSISCRCTTRKSWFILSVSGFKVDPFNGHDGYTIRRLPEMQTSDLVDAESIRTNADSVDNVGDCERQRRYVVWDHVGALDRRI